MPKVYDCFPFFNELDLLEIRLNELSKVVDYFVLAESTQTHRGLPKELIFQKNRARFAAFLDRIIHVVVNDMPAGGEAEPDRWRRENHQRQALIKGLSNASWSDWVIVSDLDEIPRHDAVKSIVERNSFVPTRYTLVMGCYFYFLNLKHRNPWGHAKMARRLHVRHLNQFRLFGEHWCTPRRQPKRLMKTIKYFGSPMRWEVVPDAGWHLTYMNGNDAIVEKLRNCAHTLPDAAITLEYAQNRVRKAVANDEFNIIPLNNLPVYVQQNPEPFSHMILR